MLSSVTVCLRRRYRIASSSQHQSILPASTAAHKTVSLSLRFCQSVTRTVRDYESARTAEAGIYRPRRDARLSWPWVAGWLHTEINVRHLELNPDTVTHLSTNRARRWLTSLIKANALNTTPDHQPGNIQYIQKQPHFASIYRFRLRDVELHFSHRTRFMGSKYTRNAFAVEPRPYLEPMKRVCWLQMSISTAGS